MKSSLTENKKVVIKKNYFIRIRHLIYAILFIVIGAAIVGPFIWQCIEINVDVKESLSIWNGFISIALGFVATTLSVVSMGLNFRTYDDALRVQRKAEKTLAELRAVKEDVQFLRNRGISLSKVTNAGTGNTNYGKDDNNWIREELKTDENTNEQAE